MSKSDVRTSEMLPKFKAKSRKLLPESDVQPSTTTSTVDVTQGEMMLKDPTTMTPNNPTSDVQASSCMASKTREERKSSESSGLELFQGF